MKKTYISPAMLTVQLSTKHHMLEGSLPIGTNTIKDDNQILVKENNVSDVNVWDNEW